MSCRAGAVPPNELEAQFGEEIDFLMARLRILEAKSEVQFVGIMLESNFVFSICRLCMQTSRNLYPKYVPK